MGNITTLVNKISRSPRADILSQVNTIKQDNIIIQLLEYMIPTPAAPPPKSVMVLAMLWC